MTSRRRKSFGCSDNPAKDHIEEIRKQKFFIGRKQINPLTQDLHHAVKSLSAELYTKDIHFLMELIQNAEDNEYLEGVEPTLEFVLTYKDITECGAPATLLVFNNEVGFSEKNMESICSVGRSTKKGKRHQGFIGEKGIGFKSVFLVSTRPHIFSKGYQVMFHEEPEEDCGIGYIVPEWIDAKPTISDIQSVYASCKTLPITTIVLPLKPDKVEAVKQQLSEVHPELLLFLSKIKRLSVREISDGSCAQNPVSAVSISSEIDLMTVKDIKADSRIVHLSVQEAADETERTCRYYIFKQAFPVKPENLVCWREDIDEWLVSLAFPFGERLKRGTSSAGVFAFLPTTMGTNFPFIIQADFILASSRESILLDNKWNLGILDCIPEAFRNAFLTCLKSREAFHLSSIAQVFEFFPVEASSFQELNNIREYIKRLVQQEHVMPCELFSNEEMVFQKPIEAMRLLPHFRKFLCHAKEQRICLDSISSHGKFIVHASLDVETYEKTLKFLGVLSVECGYWWYAECIKSCKFIKASENLYVELLYFLACNWAVLHESTIKDISLIKHRMNYGRLATCSVSDIQRTIHRVEYARNPQHHAWLEKWNIEFGCPNKLYFLPSSTEAALVSHKDSAAIENWLQASARVTLTTVYRYTYYLFDRIARERNGRKFSISLAHFVYHNHCRSLIPEGEVSSLCRLMPIVTDSGIAIIPKVTLVPTSGSKWSKLLGPSNPFRKENYVELGEVYAESGQFAGESTPKNALLNFLIKYTRAVDLPEIHPPNVKLHAASSPLTSEQAFLLLEWIQNLQRGIIHCMPSNFFQSIRDGKWLKTISGFNSPSQCFLYDGRELSIFAKVGSVLEGFSVIDQAYYNNKISLYEDQLKLLGVKLSSKDVSGLIVDRLKSLASSQISGKCAISLLKFIRYSKADDKLDEDLLESLKNEKWLKTSEGYVAPIESVFLVDEKEAVLQLTSLPCVDEMFYGRGINSFSAELKLLGVVVEVEKAYKLIGENFRFPADTSTVTAQSLLFILKCIRYVGSEAVGLIAMVKDQPWLKTTSGIRCPSESLLPGHDWGYLFDGMMLPLIDEDYYGQEVRLFVPELREIGVSVDLESAVKMISTQVKLLLSAGSLTNSAILSLLNFLRLAGEAVPNLVCELRNCLLEDKLLKTRHGYKSASDSVLFDLKWGTVHQFVDLPLIDDAFYGIDIYAFRDELKMLGVVVNFSEGARFVAKGLNFPKDPRIVTAEGALSLLQCISFIMNNSLDESLPQDFLIKLKSGKWLKTVMGYKSPEECLLYDHDWDDSLNPEDAPFIDEIFYGTSINLYKDELKAIGVKVDAQQTCGAIAAILGSCTQTSSITRIYRFLHKMKWNAELLDKCNAQIWLPNQNATDGGEWVNSQICLVHDRDNLFGSRFHVLDKYYDENLLPIFSSAFGVAKVPSIDDYVNLWNCWETNSTHKVLLKQCNSFWVYVVENWNKKTEELLRKNITKLPSTIMSDNGIQLVKKEDVFIPDNLQLKRLFSEATEKPLFVWSPQDRSFAVSKLYDVYATLGVRKISESVEFETDSTLAVDQKMEIVDPRSGLIEKGLLKIVLAFLANSQINMSLKARYSAAKALLNLSVFETNEPIMVNFCLVLPSSKERLDVKTKRLVHWEKTSGCMIISKAGRLDYRTSLEFVTAFAHSVANRMLQGKTDLVGSLSKMIEIGYAFGFQEDAVDFLLMRENLELLNKDKEFLDAAFLSEQSSGSTACKRGSSNLESTSLATYKKKRGQ